MSTALMYSSTAPSWARPLSSQRTSATVGVRSTSRRQGTKGFSESVEIGEVLTTLDVAFTTIRLDERVAVVHKHRFGECDGVLLATLDGLRYETDDDDGFVVELDELEEFSIDYVEHNLRLKVRGGRTYNFTDTEPNADTLFVFHREVDQVRTERLTDGSD